MYKLREARLREFYVNEMDPKNQQSFDNKQGDISLKL